jgi:hypothetical protein
MKICKFRIKKRIENHSVLMPNLLISQKTSEKTPTSKVKSSAEQRVITTKNSTLFLSLIHMKLLKIDLSDTVTMITDQTKRQFIQFSTVSDID